MGEKSAKPQKSVPGFCIPWEERVKDYAKSTGDADLIRREWEKFDRLAYYYIWFWLLA